MNNYKNIIKKTKKFVKNYMKNYDESHNYKHAKDVKKLALKIAKREKITDKLSLFKIKIASLCHDIADSKYTNNKDEQKKAINNFFKDKLDSNIINEIIYITTYTSLSKELDNENDNDNHNDNKILKIIQDADRIYSLGAIGVSRYFIYGIRNKNSTLKEIIKNIKNRTKLIMERIKTNYGKKIAKRKYKIIKIFLKDYYSN